MICFLHYKITIFFIKYITKPVQRGVGYKFSNDFILFGLTDYVKYCTITVYAPTSTFWICLLGFDFEYCTFLLPSIIFGWMKKCYVLYNL
jgi:hypothetical protein